MQACGPQKLGTYDGEKETIYLYSDFPPLLLRAYCGQSNFLILGVGIPSSSRPAVRSVKIKGTVFFYGITFREKLSLKMRWLLCADPT